MKDMVKVYRYHAGKDKDLITQTYLLPQLLEGEEFVTHPETKSVVMMACRDGGPHQCQLHFCYSPFYPE
jgi:hypothetical protein